MTETASECPFCIARDNLWPDVGTKIVFLKGHDTGQIATVVEDKWGNCPSDRFLVQTALEQKSGMTRMVMPRHDFYVDQKYCVAHRWMPAVSIEDNALLHERLIGRIAELIVTPDHKTLEKMLRGIIACCWWHRLPLRGIDIWPMFEAHGIESKLELKAVELFDFGIDLLIAVQGRKPIKAKRMTSMSVGRYQAKTRPRHKL